MELFLLVFVGLPLIVGAVLALKAAEHFQRHNDWHRAVADTMSDFRDEFR